MRKALAGFTIVAALVGLMGCNATDVEREWKDEETQRSLAHKAAFFDGIRDAKQRLHEALFNTVRGIRD